MGQLSSVAFTRSLQYKINSVLGCMMWETPTSEIDKENPKVVRSNMGIFMTFLNTAFFGLCNYYHYSFTSQNKKYDDMKPADQRLIWITSTVRVILFTFIPAALICASCIYNYYHKSELLMLLCIRRKLRTIGVNATTAHWIYLVQFYGVLIIYSIYFAVVVYLVNQAETFLFNENEDGKSNQGAKFNIFLFNIFRFAMMFNCVSSLALVGLRFRSIDGKLKMVFNSLQGNYDSRDCIN